MKNVKISPWRIVSTAVYAAPNEGKIYGTLDLDVTDAVASIHEEREKGSRVTITHLFTSILGRALYFDVPEVNAYLKRGKLVFRENIDVTVAVNMGNGQEMSSIKIGNAHIKTVAEIGEEVRTKAARHRQGDEDGTSNSKFLLVKIPWPFRRPAFLLIKFLNDNLGISMPSLGLSNSPFGSILLTNIGSHGLSTGHAALFPGSKLPAVIVMGGVEERPVVRNGEVVIRKMITLSGTFDHRIMDGFHGGKLAAAVRRYVDQPKQLFGKPNL